MTILSEKPDHAGTRANQLIPGSVWTIPNIVTVARTVVAVLLGVLAAASGDLWLLGAGYAAYWIGDILDGWSARRLGQETRIGAVLDIVSDRACTAVLFVGLVAHIPQALPVAAAFLPSFLVLDTMLSLAFLNWQLVSPNDFHVVDRLVWQLNWSPVAKAANTAAVVLATALGAYVLAAAIALAVGLVKIWSARRVLILLGRGIR